MTYISYPIEKAAQASRIFGAVLFVVAVLLLVFVVIVTNMSQGQAHVLGVVIVSGVYVTGGGGMLFLGSKIELAARWAVIVAMAIAGTIIVCFSIQTILVGGQGDGTGLLAAMAVDLTLGIPGLYVIARGWNALPEFRFLTNRYGVRRGFAPIMQKNSARQTTTILPPARRQRTSNGKDENLSPT